MRLSIFGARSCFERNGRTVVVREVRDEREENSAVNVNGRAEVAGGGGEEAGEELGEGDC